MIRKVLAVLILIALAGVVVFYSLTRPLPVLTVTSWAGDYGRAQAVAQMRPYAAAHRVDVHLAQWEGDLADLKGDVIDFELPKAVEACHRGLLEKISASDLPPGADGAPASRDFVPGAFGPCWIGSIVYSQVIIYAPHAFHGAMPASLADFFDTVKFPGKRALKRGSGKYNLEMALLADGVAPGAVYATLSTPEGVTRALHKLGSLGSSLVWYDANREVLALIAGGGAEFATALNQQVYDAAHNKAPVGVIWDRQLYEFDVFGVPAGNTRKDRALDYIAFATGSKPLADVASWVPYGPARRSSLPLVGKNPELGTDMRPFLATAHFQTAFAVNDEWWRSNGARIALAWNAWLANPAH